MHLFSVFRSENPPFSQMSALAAWLGRRWRSLHGCRLYGVGMGMLGSANPNVCDLHLSLYIYIYKADITISIHIGLLPSQSSLVQLQPTNQCLHSARLVLGAVLLVCTCYTRGVVQSSNAVS